MCEGSVESLYYVEGYFFGSIVDIYGIDMLDNGDGGFNVVFFGEVVKSYEKFLGNVFRFGEFLVIWVEYVFVFFIEFGIFDKSCFLFI